MNKNKKMYSALVMTAAVALMAGTFAWLTQEADVTNKFATPFEGSYGSQIVETVFDEESGEDKTFKYTDPDNEWDLVVPDQFKPGDSIKKEVYFENTGTYDQLVRIQFNPQLSEGLLLVGNEALGEHWVDGQDGYYYYKHVLVAGAKTEVILESIKFNEEYVGSEVDMDATIYIGLETVQLSDGNIAAINEFGVVSAVVNTGGSVNWGF